MKAKSLFKSNLFIYFLVFLLGWCTYSLKLVSIIKLLGELDFKFYPILMLAQGTSLFLSMKIMTKISEQNEKIFYFTALFAGFGLVFFTSSTTLNQWAKLEFSWMYSCVVFMLSTFIILAIDITTRLLVTNKLSLLENPKASAYVNFAEELGVILGASITLGLASSVVNLFELFTPITMTLPFTLALLCLTLISKQESAPLVLIENPKIRQALDEHSYRLRRNIGKYLWFMVALVCIVMVCKHLQGFAVFVGLKKWQELTQQSISTIFSILAIVQNGLIMIFILPSLFGNRNSTRWSRGFNFFFSLQTLSMFFIVAFPFATSLIGSGVLRKIAQRAFLNPSMTMLIASIPKAIRFEIKSKSQKFAHSISYLVLASLSYLAINQYIKFEIVWLVAALISLSGFFVLNILLRKLNFFHAKNIKEFKTCPFNVYEAISSCYALANRDACRYYHDLARALELEETAPIFKKAVIHTIGEMRNKESVNYLMALFRKLPREDIQLEILRALNKHNRLEIDHFFQNVLKETMFSDTGRGELRISFCEIISQRMPESSVSLATRVIENHPTDSRVVGNAVDVLGDIADRVRSKKIYEYLAKFLSPEYKRRVRINAIKHLYHLPKYRSQIEEIILNVHNSSEMEDRTGAAYLYGVLGITDHLPYVQALNTQTGCRNATVLLSLLRLNQENVEADIVNLLREATPQQAKVYINQIYRVKEKKLRYTVYFHLLQYHPENLNDILHLMRDSQKNFDMDRLAIIKEADRLGIKISDDLLYRIH